MSATHSFLHLVSSAPSTDTVGAPASIKDVGRMFEVSLQRLAVRRRLPHPPTRWGPRHLTEVFGGLRRIASVATSAPSTDKVGAPASYIDAGWTIEVSQGAPQAPPCLPHLPSRWGPGTSQKCLVDFETRSPFLLQSRRR